MVNGIKKQLFRIPGMIVLIMLTGLSVCVANNSPAWYYFDWMATAPYTPVFPLGNEFILHRFSTNQTIKVSLKPGVFPSDVLGLEQKIRAGTFTLNEMLRCQQEEWDYAKHLLNTSPEKCFIITEMKGFQWTPDSYEHRSKRGDIVNRNCLRLRRSGSDEALKVMQQSRLSR